MDFDFPTTDEEIRKLILGSPQLPQTTGGLLGSAPAEPQEDYQQQTNLESLGKTLDVIKKLKDTFTPQQTPQPSQQITPKEEKLSANEQINNAVLNANSLQGKPQLSDSTPNYLTNQALGEILRLKALNELAPAGEAGDAERKRTNDQANYLRDTYAAAGMNLDQFGADNATSRDTAQYMYAQRLKDLYNAIMPDGKYYRSADDYYNDKYEALVMGGYSPGQARRAARSMARDYQAERVGYLDAVYNNYGRDGYVNNEFAAQILPKIAQENPMLANFYGNFYPGAKDEYNQQNKLTEKILDNRNQTGQLNFGLLTDIIKMAYGGDVDMARKRCQSLGIQAENANRQQHS